MGYMHPRTIISPNYVVQSPTINKQTLTLPGKSLGRHLTETHIYRDIGLVVTCQESERCS